MCVYIYIYIYVAFTPSLLLLVLADEFVENPPFWQKTPQFIVCPISSPPPLENDPTPFTKNIRLVPGFSYSRNRKLGGAHQKKHQTMGTV